MVSLLQCWINKEENPCPATTTHNPIQLDNILVDSPPVFGISGKTSTHEMNDHCSWCNMMHSSNWQLINRHWFDQTTASLSSLVSTKPAHCRHPILSGSVKLHYVTCAQHCTILMLSCWHAYHSMICTSRRHRRLIVAAHSLTYTSFSLIHIQANPHAFSIKIWGKIIGLRVRIYSTIFSASCSKRINKNQMYKNTFVPIH